MELDEDLTTIPDEKCLLRSHNAIGHGIFSDIQDIVYVKTENYSPANNPAIAEEIEQINRKILNQPIVPVSPLPAPPLEECLKSKEARSLDTPPKGEQEGAGSPSYLLIGPGRWGSSDPWLGIPVKWSHISAAQVIVEAGLNSFQVDPSQGTHFFQNLTSLGVCYLTINDFRGDGIYRQDILDALPAEQETEHVRHVRLPAPLNIMVDGCKKEAVVIMEEKN